LRSRQPADLHGISQLAAIDENFFRGANIERKGHQVGTRKGHAVAVGGNDKGIRPFGSANHVDSVGTSITFQRIGTITIAPDQFVGAKPTVL